MSWWFIRLCHSFWRKGDYVGFYERLVLDFFLWQISWGKKEWFVRRRKDGREETQLTGKWFFPPPPRHSLLSRKIEWTENWSSREKTSLVVLFIFRGIIQEGSGRVKCPNSSQNMIRWRIIIKLCCVCVIHAQMGLLQRGGWCQFQGRGQNFEPPGGGWVYFSQEGGWRYFKGGEQTRKVMKKWDNWWIQRKTVSSLHSLQFQTNS